MVPARASWNDLNNIYRTSFCVGILFDKSCAPSFCTVAYLITSALRGGGISFVVGVLFGVQPCVDCDIRKRGC
jgi:hypothetical protein